MAIRSLKTGTFTRSGMAGNPVIMPGSYESIATLSGNGSSSQLTFSSIPSTYSHLQIRLIARGVRSYGSEQLYVRLNTDSGNNYAYHYLYGDGSGPTTGSQTTTNTFFAGEFPAANETSGIYNGTVIDILDYASANKNTTMRSLGGYDNNGNTGVNSAKCWFGSGLWINTAAVTSVTILSNGAFTTDTTIALYGAN